MISKYPLKKIVVNTGLGRMSALSEFEKTLKPAVAADLAKITGQKPQERPSKKSIAGFKLRQGIVIGMRTTLRHKRMMDFLSRVTNIVIPRIRDFQGIKVNNIDSDGNLSFGIKEHTVFPEIVLEDTKVTFGLQITLVPQKSMSKEEAIKFYRELGVPLEREVSTAK